MTVEDIIDDARQHLSDVEATAWTGPVLIQHVVKAVAEVVARRPDFLLQPDGTLVAAETVYGLDDEDDAINLPASAQGALMLLTCHWALARDSDEKANLDRALVYRNLAERALGVGG